MMHIFWFKNQKNLSAHKRVMKIEKLLRKVTTSFPLSSMKIREIFNVLIEKNPRY